MLAKEEMLQVEENIEDALDKVTPPPPASGSATTTTTSGGETNGFKRLEKAAVQAVEGDVTSLQQDPAAKDLSDSENVPQHIKEMFDDENSAKAKQAPTKKLSEKQNGGGPK